MGLLDSVGQAMADRIGGALLEELRGIRRALEVQADATRALVNLPAVFAFPEPEEEGQASAAPTGTPAVGFQVLDALYELAVEAKLHVDPDTDIIALGIGQGWLSSDGRLLQVPASLIGKDLGPDILAQP